MASTKSDILLSKIDKYAIFTHSFIFSDASTVLIRYLRYIRHVQYKTQKDQWVVLIYLYTSHMVHNFSKSLRQGQEWMTTTLVSHTLVKMNNVITESHMM